MSGIVSRPHRVRNPRVHSRDASAEILVPQRPSEVYDFLADLQNHWQIGDRFLRLQQLDPQRRNSHIVLRGPLGLRRTVHAHLGERIHAHRISGTVHAGRQSRATVGWQLRPDGSGTRVVLGACVERVSLVDRLLLAFGARWWLRRRFRGTLRNLARTLERIDARVHPQPGRSSSSATFGC